ncbi:metallophosphoesterase [Mesorhizobium sp. M1340]|uniref:metallophosphoesterase n=1 Tax=unclassified Mesorhizobium TaxID=325217 RepID=UPI0033353B89
MPELTSGSPLRDLKNLNEDTIKEGDLHRLPHMTSWFEPVLLLKLLLRVIVSDIFGQYADRRLMEAALDPASKEDHVTRAQIEPIVQDEDGAVWIDYVSDLGDGFDATYAIAFLLAQPMLSVDGHQLPRAGLLVMGGDQVYPTALRDDYKIKMRLPYDLAWPVPRGAEKTPLFLLPGNHDWYDGLVTFLSIFCREKPTKIGGWSTRQRRSYFAVQVTENWWIWGIDIALVRDMDQPQADYFVAIAKAMPENANIILCSAEPGWYKAEAKGDSYRTLSYAAQIARNARKHLRIPLVLSGDSHHYARYEGDGTHYITSGGGGAFLHGTLELQPEIKAEWLQSAKEALTLRACYPSKQMSDKLLKGDMDFGRLNGGLTWALSALYLVFSFLLTYTWRADVAVGIFLVLLAGFWGYSLYQEGSWKKTAIPSIAHASAHWIVVAAFSWSALWANHAVMGDFEWHWIAWLLVLAVPIFLLGPWLAGKIYGISLMLGCRYFDISHNDAFSAMKLDSHRHFLRIRLKGDAATVFPVKLEKVPAREQWRANPERKTDPSVSVFASDPQLSPQMLEEPISILARAAASTSDVKTPGEMPSKS